MKIDFKNKLWVYLGIALVVVIVSLMLLTTVANKAACEARWQETYKVVKYGPLTGCLVEYPAESGSMVPEEAIRLNEPSKPSAPEVAK